jgi:uncharacterized protein
MQQQITLLAQLSVIDAQLDELHDDLGELPVEVKKHATRVREQRVIVEDLQKSVHEIEHLQGNAHVTQQELTDRETKLTEQQFQVKNNKEFDAITAEIEHVKATRSSLDEQLRTASVKEENLRSQLNQHAETLEEYARGLANKEQELADVSGDHTEELKKLGIVRKRITSELDSALEREYERIRTFHRAAVVPLRRNSCSGCFSAIPSQKIMEMKYNRDKVYTCESCGRILVTEDVVVDLETLIEA